MKSILIIEDDKFLRNLLATTLGDNGFEVKESSGGDDGIKKAKEGRFDMIILDLIMPDVDGYEVIKELKADQSTKNVPILVLSNLGGSDIVERVMDLGANFYLVKALYTLDEIVKKVQEFIEESQK